MKKLYAATILAILFIFSCFIAPRLNASQEQITLSLPEYTNNEFKVIDLEEIDVAEIEAKYAESSSPVLEANTYVQNTVYNNTNNVVATQNTNTNSVGRLGNIGRISIPAVGYSAALYNGLLGNSQGIVDAYDSACYIAYDYCTTYIGDHYYQGFASMKNSVPGVTTAYIYGNDGSVSTYICVEKHYNGIKNGYVYDEYGRDIYDAGFDIAMVTCNDNTSVSVTITYWNRI